MPESVIMPLMITKPTVLVLGAGASSPYGYPTGKQLKQNIIDKLEQPSVDIYRSILEQGFDDKKIIEFRKAFLLSGQSSVDAFLEHQPDLMELGKLVITSVLARSENMEKLFKTGDWYEHLFHALDTGVIDDFGENQLSVITFNYDRSLETFLFNSLKYSYNLTDKNATEILSKIPIIHLHGQMGNLPWQDASNNRDYGEKDNNQRIKQSSEGIKIISEAEVEKSDVFIKAKEYIANAERVYFLGFGYHPENIRRLGISEIDTGHKIVYGTCMRMTDMEAEGTMVRCNRKIDLKQKGSQHFTILQFMRENISLT